MYTLQNCAVRVYDKTQTAELMKQFSKMKLFFIQTKLFIFASNNLNEMAMCFLSRKLDRRILMEWIYVFCCSSNFENRNRQFLWVTIRENKQIFE